MSEPDILKPIRRPLALTRLGMGAEQVVRGFWPVWSVGFVVLAALMLGLHDAVAVEWVWAAGVLAALSALWFAVQGLRRFRWPSRADAMARLDATLPGRPIQSLLDDPAIGADDAGSLGVWQAHQARMAQRLAQARAQQPDLRVSRRDPYALRYVAVLALLTALVFGAFGRVGSVADMGPGAGAAMASGPAWEGWVEPPVYTGMPTLYLNDQMGDMSVAEGSLVTLQLYGTPGALSVAESISGKPLVEEPVTEPSQNIAVAQSGALTIDGSGGRAWQIAMIPDAAPSVRRDGEVEANAEGQMQLPFSGADDHGIVAGTAVITLALDEVDRRYGLTIAPEARPAIEVPLPMPISGDRSEFTETLIEDFSQHPWANMPVTISLRVTDDRDQVGIAPDEVITLRGRRFFDPMAAAVIEMRRDLLWSRENGPRIAKILRAVSHLPQDVFRSEIAGLRLRQVIKRLETLASYGLTDEQQNDMAQDLWDLAITLEEGDLADALERLRRAQDRLE